MPGIHDNNGQLLYLLNMISTKPCIFRMLIGAALTSKTCLALALEPVRLLHT